jgi:hypothetical protein
VSVRGHSVAVITHGWRTEVFRYSAGCAANPVEGRVGLSHGSCGVVAGRTPGGVLVGSGEPGEHPKTLGEGPKTLVAVTRTGGKPKFSDALLAGW